MLSVPPVSVFIFPVYPQVHVLHGWISLAAAVPFVVAVVGHGLPAWRTRGFGPATRSGLAVSVAFPLALASGVYHMQLPGTVPWVLVAHFASGLGALVAAYVHSARPSPGPVRRGPAPGAGG